MPPLEAPANAAAARRLLEVGVRAADVDVLEEIESESVVVHTPAGPASGSAGILAGRAHGAEIDVKRTVASGDLVVVHSLISAPGEPRVVFDVFRFEGARIVEAWSVTQPMLTLAEATNPHPHF